MMFLRQSSDIISLMSQTRICFRAITWLLVNAAVNAKTSNGCPSRDLSVTADDYMSLFIDGQEIADLTNADNWRYPDTLDLPCTTRVIAIEANDTGGEGGIRASTVDGYIKTNSSWKCTNKRIPGWQGFGFNDSSWMKAVVVPNFESLPEATKNSFRKDAMWIWTRGYEGQDLNVFCRFKLDVDDCLIGQTIIECDPSMGRCIKLLGRGYNCSCYPGYQNDGQNKCKDVDECLLGSPAHKCNTSSGNCINTPGSYKCRCYEGFANVGDQQCEGSSNNSALLILGVSLGVSFLIVVAVIVALSIFCSRTSTSKAQGRSVASVDANRSEIAPRTGSISSNKSPPDRTYLHLTLNAMHSNQSDNYEQIID